MTCLHRLQTTFLSRMQLCSRRKRREEEEDEKLGEEGSERASSTRGGTTTTHTASPQLRKTRQKSTQSQLVSSVDAADTKGTHGKKKIVLKMPTIPNLLVVW